MKIIICDIDGTIADCSKRLHYIQDKNGKKLDKPNWKSFYAEVNKDEPIKAVVEMIEQLDFEYINASYTIVFLTGRNEVCREKTYEWLRTNINISGYPLIMRAKNDRRPDTEVKPDLLNKYLKDNPDDEAAFILDDQTHMIDKWEELGYTTLQVRQSKINN